MKKELFVFVLQSLLLLKLNQVPVLDRPKHVILLLILVLINLCAHIFFS